MTKKNLLSLDISTIANMLDNGELSSVELTKLCFQQIDNADPNINAFLWFNRAKSLKEAENSDNRRKRNEALSLLDGVPLAIKDMILVKDIKANAASKILENYIPPYEARVIENLREKGAVILGKTNQDEFAMGSSNELSAYKTCFNPHNRNHSPGGSSGGSAAAVSAEMAFASLGTDTGGSIRQPASFCGVVGLKPTYGRVSRFGVIAFASSLDQVGPITRNVKDSALMLSAIAGYDERDATSVKLPVPDYVKDLNADVRGKRIGVPNEFFGEGLDDNIKESVTKVLDILKKNGAEIVSISLPHNKYAVATYYIIATAEAASNLSRYDGIRYGPRAKSHKDLLSLYEKTRGELFGKEVKRRIALGTYVLSAGYYDAYYLYASKVRKLFAEDFKNAFKTVDAIISPTTPTTAFKIGEKVDKPLSMYLNDIFTIGANLSGVCALSIPTGKDKNHMPIGTQIMAKPFCEQTLFDTATVIEKELNLNLRPPLTL